MEYRNKLKTLLFGRDMESMVCHGLRKCMKDFPQIEADYGKARENIIHQLGEEAQRLSPVCFGSGLCGLVFCRCPGTANEP